MAGNCIKPKLLCGIKTKKEDCTKSCFSFILRKIICEHTHTIRYKNTRSCLNANKPKKKVNYKQNQKRRGPGEREREREREREMPTTEQRYIQRVEGLIHADFSVPPFGSGISRGHNNSKKKNFFFIPQTRTRHCSWAAPWVARKQEQPAIARPDLWAPRIRLQPQE